MKREQIEQLEKIPQELKERGLFCIWKYEEVNGRLTKVPYKPSNPEKKAGSTRQTDFGTFAQARAAAAGETVDGVGLGIFGTVAAIDIDHCIDENGDLSQMADEIMDMMHCYTEISPSGSGVRILFEAPGLTYDKDVYYIKNPNNGVEIYIAGMTSRYVTVTGRRYGSQDGERHIEDRSAEVIRVIEQYMKKPEPAEKAPRTAPTSPLSLSDAELIEKASNAKNGATFSRLWSGDTSANNNDHSSADLALCSILAYWTQCDALRIDDLFRRSGLYREKWERDDYRTNTINKAIDSTTEVYDLGRPNNDDVYLSWGDGITADGHQLPSAASVPDPTDQDAPPVAGSTAQAETVPASEPEKTPEEMAAELYAQSGPGMVDAFLDTIKTRRYEPIPTGIHKIDFALSGGLVRKTLVTLGAAPGMGKTAIAQYIGENIATRGTDVLYLNLEMDRDQLLARSLSRILYTTNKYYDVSSLEMLRGYNWQNDQGKCEAIEDAARFYKNTIAPHFKYNPDTMKDTNKLSKILEACEREAKIAEAQGKEAPIVFVDYLQLIECDYYNAAGRIPDAAEGLKMTLKKLKDFAINYNTVVIAVMAHNRASNASGAATMESGRDTSAIEYTADVMLALNYTAIEDREKFENGEYKSDTGDHNKGDMKFSPVTLEYIRIKIDAAELFGADYPLIAKRVCLKVLKSRFSRSGNKVRFIFDGRHNTFTEDDTRDALEAGITLPNLIMSDGIIAHVKSPIDPTRWDAELLE